MQVSANTAGKFSRIITFYSDWRKGNLKQNITFHGYNTRHKLNFNVQFCNADMDIKLYDHVPDRIKNWKTLHSLHKN